VLYFTDLALNGGGPSVANEETASNLESMISLAYYSNSFKNGEEATMASSAPGARSWRSKWARRGTCSSTRWFSGC